MPRVGEKLAPPPSDIQEIVTNIGAPQDSVKPFDESLDAEYAGTFDKWTSPEARKAKANRVTHTHTDRIGLYDALGNSREIDAEDLFIVTDTAIEPRLRLYARCPLCTTLSNRGQHEFSGPNSCPARPAQRFMVCPICASAGFNKKVYESAAPVGLDADLTDDPNFVAATLPGASTPEERLRENLGQHMTAFHPAESQSLYGVRRESNDRGFRVIWGRD